jgi:nitrate/TMAO reductase-like tetraheme cytochrome c subunit
MTRTTIAACIAAAVFAGMAAGAIARERVAPAPANATYDTECGSCHIAYPPRLLAAPSWKRVVQSLDKHFGADASLDPATAAAIGDYLDTYAQPATSKRYDPAASRITETRWFRKEHDEIAADVFRRASVATPANCAACHTRAAQGQFNEHDVRIPRS